MGRKEGPRWDPPRTLGSMSHCPLPHRLDRLPSTVLIPTCLLILGVWRRSPPSPVCWLRPRTLLCQDSTRLGRAWLPAWAAISIPLAPFCWGYQSSAFPGWLCFNLSPWSRLCRLLLSLSQEEMEAPGLLGRLWSQRISRNRSRDRLAATQPANLPLSKLAGELLKMQFPLIFPVKLLPVPSVAVFLSLASWGLDRTVIHLRPGPRELTGSLRLFGAYLFHSAEIRLPARESCARYPQSWAVTLSPSLCQQSLESPHTVAQDCWHFRSLVRVGSSSLCIDWAS